MYAEHHTSLITDQKKKDVLTPELVGVLLRQMPKISHPAKNWGDPEKDHVYKDRLPELLARYDLSAIMTWILSNPNAGAYSYGAKIATRWNAAHAVAVDVTNSGVPVVHYGGAAKNESVEVVHGAIKVCTNMEILNHQLASLMVAINPQGPDKSTLPYDFRPIPCDPQGNMGPSCIAIPFLPERKDSAGKVKPESQHGGPLYKAYTHNTGGTESLVARLETVLNKPPEIDVSVGAQHKSICDLLALKCAEEGVKAPKWFAPFETRVINNVSMKVLQYQTTFSEKVFTDLDQYYLAHTYMSNTCGTSKRASYVYDGHFFCDLPAGMAHKIHILDNLMNFVHLVGGRGVDVTTMPAELKCVASLLPLNLPCFAPYYESEHVLPGGKKKKRGKAAITPVQAPQPVSTFHDPRFRPGLYHSTQQMTGLVMFRTMEYDRPSRKDKVTVYTPQRPGDVIQNQFANWPPRAGCPTAYITIAHSQLWASPENFIYPLDFLSGLVMVARGDRVSANSPAHWPYKMYLNMVSKFIHTRAVYPYSRLSWPQISGIKTSRVALKKGDISASDVSLAEIKAQFSAGGAYVWAVDEAQYVDMDFSPPKVVADAIVPQLPLPDPVDMPDDDDVDPGPKPPPDEDPVPLLEDEIPEELLEQELLDGYFN